MCTKLDIYVLSIQCLYCHKTFDFWLKIDYNDLWQKSCFLGVFRFPPQIKLLVRRDIAEILLKWVIKHAQTKLTLLILAKLFTITVLTFFL